MADYRTIQSKIYRDDWFSRQQVDAKFLFIYLFTNPSASVAGIYELPIRFVSVDTGISEERVREILAGFQDDGKVEWCEPLIWIKKMREYQATNSPALKLRIQRDLAIIPNCGIKQHHAEYYGDPVPTVLRPSRDVPIKTDKTDPIRNNTNNGANAPLNGNHLKPSDSVKPLDDYHAATKALEEEFARLTGLPLPPRETKRQQTEAATLWWNPLMAILQIAEQDITRAKSLMQKTIAYMSQQNLTFDAPVSIVRVARSQSKTVQVGTTQRKLRGPND